MKAQSLTGIDAGDFSRVHDADFRRISVERLMVTINGLCSRVKVAVTLRRAPTMHAAAVARSVKSGYESRTKSTVTVTLRAAARGYRRIFASNVDTPARGAGGVRVSERVAPP